MAKEFLAYFCPNQHPHYVKVKVADSGEEAFRLWVAADAEVNLHPTNEWLADTGAFTVYNHNSQTDNLGTIVFLERSRRIICHECVHAALSFLDHKVMVSEKVKSMTEEDQYEYFQEALATTTDELFAQIEEKIFGDSLDNPSTKD